MSAATESGLAADLRNRTLAYRPDIDGLRALAVMLVVLNHAGLAWLPGGFVGVDVFCVISGFLITGLIAVQREEGRFSFASFYLRRAQRLLPALYAMMLVVLVAGWWLMIPSDYSALAESVLAAVGLAANVYFWLTSGGYFSPDAASLPLLHVWSLSLEEQFYLVWPAALMLLIRVKSARARLAVILIAAAASFALAQYGVAQGSTAPYFLLPQRAGEFLAGAILFFLSQGWRGQGRGAAAAGAGLAGLALVLASAALLDARSSFPGLTALAPCLGAALLIAAGGLAPNPVTHVLASLPVVAVGRISYSVYLWHWPLVSFLRYARVEFTPVVTAGVVGGALVLGWASWALFERGFRLRLARRERPALAAAGLTAALLIAAPVGIHLRDGLPGRFPYALLTQEELMAERARYWRELPAAKASFSEGEAARRTLIVGNSHAYDLAWALTENGYPGEVKLIGTTQLCANFGHDPVQPADVAFCDKRVKKVLESAELKAADIVLLHDHWPTDDLEGLAAMIGELRAVTDAPIVVFGPKMTLTDDVLAISKTAQGRRMVTARAINRFAAGYQDPAKPARDARLKTFFAERALPGVTYVGLLDLQCGEALACDILSPDGQYLYFDAYHFTLAGSRRVGARLKAAYPELFSAAPPG
ncbi:MAG: acyltransferase family protein [Phenylobacterium sp.]|nr:acyltransferase family protein [Phenylobacterium sp.]